MPEEKGWRITYRLPCDPEVIAEKTDKEPEGVRFQFRFITEVGDELVVCMGQEGRDALFASLQTEPQLEIIP